MTDIVIKAGQTLSSIAAEHNVSVDTLMTLNPDIKNPNSIMAGAALKISNDTPQTEQVQNGFTVKGAQLEKNTATSSSTQQSSKYSTKEIALGALAASAAWKLGQDAYGVAKQQVKKAGNGTLKIARSIPGKVTNIAKNAAAKAKGMVH